MDYRLLPSFRVGARQARQLGWFMNLTSRAILQTLLTTDASLTGSERSAVQRLIKGEPDGSPAETNTGKPLLITQKMAANLLSVSRVTIWRMTKDGVLHPVEILPGTLRYTYQEIAAIAQQGVQMRLADGRQ